MFFSIIASAPIVAAMGNNFGDAAKAIESIRQQYGESTIAAVESKPGLSVTETSQASSAQSIPNMLPGKEHYI